MSKLTPATGSMIKGTLYGLLAVAIWAIYMSFTRSAVSDSLTPFDIVVMRFGVAGIIMLCWTLWYCPNMFGGVGLYRGIALAAAAGPVFILVASAAFIYVPLAHGAVLQPSTAALSSIAAAVFILKEKVTIYRIAGAVVIISGITLMATGSNATLGVDAWKGYVLSVLAGLCWAIFTILIRRWSISGLAATAAVSVISAIITVPLFFIFDTVERISALPTETLIAQLLVQGVLAGVVAIVAYGRAITHLEASGAALFPALVPAAALLVGIPITGEWPTVIEWIGALMATIGLMIAVGVFKQSRIEGV